MGTVGRHLADYMQGFPSAQNKVLTFSPCFHFSAIHLSSPPTLSDTPKPHTHTHVHVNTHHSAFPFAHGPPDISQCLELLTQWGPPSAPLYVLAEGITKTFRMRERSHFISYPCARLGVVLGDTLITTSDAPNGPSNTSNEQAVVSRKSVVFFCDQRLKHNMTNLRADRQGLIQMAWALQGPGATANILAGGGTFKRNKNMSENLTGSKAGSKIAPVQSRSCWLTSSAMIKGRMGGVGVFWGSAFVGWCLVQLNQSRLTHYVFMLQCLSRLSLLIHTNTLRNVWGRHNHIWRDFQLVVSLYLWLYKSRICSMCKVHAFWINYGGFRGIKNNE